MKLCANECETDHNVLDPTRHNVLDPNQHDCKFVYGVQGIQLLYLDLVKTLVF